LRHRVVLIINDISVWQFTVCTLDDHSKTAAHAN